jgi:DNA-binding CsgD family transcriptional regulator
MLDNHVATIRKDSQYLKKPTYRSPSKVKRNNAIIQCRRDGKTLMQIAKQFKISKNRVFQILLKYKKTQVN